MYICHLEHLNEVLDTNTALVLVEIILWCFDVI